MIRTRKDPISRIMLAAAILVFGAETARAELIINITQVPNDDPIGYGYNVVMTASGTIDLSGLTYLGSGSNGPGIDPGSAQVILGAVGTTSDASFYYGATGPHYLGYGGASGATLGNGDIIGVVGFENEIIVPQGYTSGSPLTATDTYYDETLLGLGITTTGTVTYTWGDPDSLVLNIIAAAAVPEPSSAFLAALGAGAVAILAYGRTHHRREQRCRPSE
jgi:hypothetical protein